MKTLIALALCAAPLFAADAAAPSAKDVYDRQLKSTESEFVSLVEAMPADKFQFAPKQGTFTGVRTFAAQAKHVAAVLDMLSAALLGEKAEGNENGSDKLVAKDDIVKYVKASFAHAHKAVATLTNANLMEMGVNPFDPKAKQAKAATANEMFWHTFDHYGQMVVYARMNAVVPPASR